MLSLLLVFLSVTISISCGFYMLVGVSHHTASCIRQKLFRFSIAGLFLEPSTVPSPEYQVILDE